MEEPFFVSANHQDKVQFRVLEIRYLGALSKRGEDKSRQDKLCPGYLTSVSACVMCKCSNAQIYYTVHVHVQFFNVRSAMYNV